MAAAAPPPSPGVPPPHPPHGARPEAPSRVPSGAAEGEAQRRPGFCSAAAALVPRLRVRPSRAAEEGDVRRKGKALPRHRLFRMCRLRKVSALPVACTGERRKAVVRWSPRRNSPSLLWEGESRSALRPPREQPLSPPNLTGIIPSMPSNRTGNQLLHPQKTHRGSASHTLQDQALNPLKPLRGNSPPAPLKPLRARWFSSKSPLSRRAAGMG